MKLEVYGYTWGEFQEGLCCCKQCFKRETQCLYCIYVLLLIKTKYYSRNRWFVKVAIHDFIFYFQHAFSITLVPKRSGPKIH